MLFTVVYCFQISLRSRDIQVFKICKLQSDDVIHSIAFSSNMINKDISVNLYNKCLTFYNTILLEVLDMAAI